MFSYFQLFQNLSVPEMIISSNEKTACQSTMSTINQDHELSFFRFFDHNKKDIPLKFSFRKMSLRVQCLIALAQLRKYIGVLFHTIHSKFVALLLQLHDNRYLKSA